MFMISMMTLIVLTAVKMYIGYANAYREKTSSAVMMFL